MMNTIRIPLCSAASDRPQPAAQPLLPCRWSPAPPPEVRVCAACVGEDLIVRLTSFALPSRAVNTAPDSSVWEDDCLEFFFSFGGPDYVNLETNANGALRASTGPDRHARRFLRALGVPLPAVRILRGADSWTAEFTVPEALAEALYGVRFESGLRFRGNFYACGDRTPAPYYASWNPVETETPDFHRPEYFGELLLD